MNRNSSNFIFPLITQVTASGVRFCLETSASDCGIILYDRKSGDEIGKIAFDSSDRIGNLYCKTVPDIDPARTSYLYYIGNKQLSDKRALSLLPSDHYGKELKEPLKALIYNEDYDWEGESFPALKYEDSFWYLLHVRGFTKSSSSGVKGKGTFSGIVEKLDHLQSMGITTVELQPAYDFEDWDEETARLNYWGYKPGFYYAPKAVYAHSKDPVREFKDLVKALHFRKMEVCMQFYFAADFPEAEILEILRYWVVTFHVDAFHLMGMNIPMSLVASDPMLAGTKILSDHLESISFDNIRKPGDRRVIGYYSDDFQYPLRKLLKSDDGQVSDVLTQLRSNPEENGRINFFSSYRGFTLMDMVSYDRKHNEDNGEDGRDGSDYNFSWNCGEEGPTRKKKVKDLREKQIRNAYSLLMLGAGTPLIFMGDEFGNSQKGNNNPYCIDSQVTWLDWKDEGKNAELTAFLKKLVELRKSHTVFHNSKELYMTDTSGTGFPEISYHSDTAWRVSAEYYSKSFGIMFCEKDGKLLYAAVNMNWENTKLALPRPPKGAEWKMILSTDQSLSDKKVSGSDAKNASRDQFEKVIPGRTVVFYETYKTENKKPAAEKAVK